MTFILKNNNFSLEFDDLGNVLALAPIGGKNLAVKTPISVLIDNDKNEISPESAQLLDDVISVKFTNGVSVKIRVKVYNEFMTFTLEYASSQNFHSVKFINLLTDIDYDNEEYDNDAYSSCLMSLTLATHMKEHAGKNTELIATAYTHIGLFGNKRSPYNPACAVIVCKNKDLIRIEREVLDIIPDGELPKSKLGGPYAENAKKSALKTYSLHWTPITKENYDFSVDYFRKAGIEQINLHHICQYSQGSFEVLKSAYPGGIEELKETVRRLHADGFEVGFHPYVFFIAPNDSYVTPIPHDDLAVLNEYTLKKDLSLTDTEVYTEEDLSGVSTFISYIVVNSKILRIGNELIKFNSVDGGKFYNVERGLSGTTVTEHKKGDKITHYKQYFDCYYFANPGSELFYQVARNAAKFYNEVGFDSIYFDALDGAAILDGEDYAWYHATDFVREFFNNIDHDPVFDGCHNLQYTGTWFVRSRFGAVDSTAMAYDEFNDSHVLYNQKVAKRMGVTAELGWVEVYKEKSSRTDYYLQNMPNRRENMAYLYGKMMATDACTTYIELLPKAHDIPAVQEHWATVREFNDYRNKHELSKEGKKYLSQVRTGCMIDDGVLKQATYDVYRFEHEGKVNAINNAFKAQKPFIRIENLYSASSYESDGVVLTESMSLKEGVSKTYRFGETDLTKHLGLGVWAKGDNGGGIIRLTIGSLKGGGAVRGTYVIKNDFVGWRYFALVEQHQGEFKELPIEEVDNSTYTNLQKYYGYYRSEIPYNRIEFFAVDYLGKGEMEIKPIKAVAHETRVMKTPTLIFGDKKLTFNVTLNSTDTLECDVNGNVRVIDTKFNVLSNPTFTGEIPTLDSGLTNVKFECESDKQTRARVTIGLLGEPII